MNNKKKLLIGSLSTAAVVAGVAMTGGTSAYFYDLESSAREQFSRLATSTWYARATQSSRRRSPKAALMAATRDQTQVPRLWRPDEQQPGRQLCSHAEQPSAR